MENVIFDKEQCFGELNQTLKKDLKNQPTIYRLTWKNKNQRIYFTYQDDKLKLYNSGTTLIDNYKDHQGEKRLEDYRIGLINKGKDPASILIDHQDYGTLLHLFYAKLLSGFTFYIRDLLETGVSLASELNMSQDRVRQVIHKNKFQLEKDIISFIKWVQDFKVKPLGIEVMVKNDKYQVATALDLVCVITYEKIGYWGVKYKTGVKVGEPRATKKEVTETVIVDFKSGQSGFYPKHILQLILSKDILRGVSSLNVDGIWNFAPQNKKSTISYRFINQGIGVKDKESLNRKHMHKVAKNVFERGLMEFEDFTLNSKIEEVVGKVGIKGDMENCIKSQPLMDYVLNYFSECSNTKYIITKLMNLGIKVEELNNVKVPKLKEAAKTLSLRYKNKKQFIQQIKALLEV